MHAPWPAIRLTIASECPPPRVRCDHWTMRWRIVCAGAWVGRPHSITVVPLPSDPPAILGRGDVECDSDLT
jgi:hypothetical protein